MASLFISSLVSQLLFDYDNFNSAFGKLPIDHHKITHSFIDTSNDYHLLRSI